MRLASVEFEILRHKLWTILAEGRAALKRVSGSPTVAFGEAMAALYSSKGECVLSGTGVLLHVMGAPEVITRIMEIYGDDIREGDVFFSNDPWIGTAHTADQYCIAPIFYGDEVVAWGVTLTHVGDIGGIEPGSMPSTAKEIFHEGFVIPFLKIADKKGLRQDFVEFVHKNLRDPEMYILDVKAKIAGLEVIRKRILDVIEKYGIEKFRALMSELIEKTTEIARNKISKLPDKKLTAVGYIDYDGVEYVVKKVVCTLIKNGDRLVFDFSGTDEQNPSPLNCTYYGTLGSVFVALMGTLFYDTYWNSGLLKNVEIVAPEGTLVNARWPSACSQAPPAPGKLITGLVTHLISRLMLESGEKELELSASASWSTESASVILGGVNQFGARFGGLLWESGHLAGTGANIDMDGCDSGGSQMHPIPSCPDVEVYEQKYPVLYLYRKHRKDSCGFGKYRGGVGVEAAYMIYNAKGEVKVNIAGGYGGSEIISFPLNGGLPAETVKSCFVIFDEKPKVEDVFRIVNRIEDAFKLGGQVFVGGGLTKSFTLKNGDIVLAYSAQGGAGFGDPIDRDPEMVRKDVEDEITSVDVAEKVYGVRLIKSRSGFVVDLLETEKLRRDMRMERIKKSRDVEGDMECLECGFRSDYRKYRDIKLRNFFFNNSVLNESGFFGMRAYYCPKCGSQVDVEVYLKGE